MHIDEYAELHTPRTWVVTGYDGNNNFVRRIHNVSLNDLGDHIALTFDNLGYDVTSVIMVEDSAFVVFDGIAKLVSDLEAF